MSHVVAAGALVPRHAGITEQEAPWGERKGERKGERLAHLRESVEDRSAAVLVSACDRMDNRTAIGEDIDAGLTISMNSIVTNCADTITSLQGLNRVIIAVARACHSLLGCSH